VTRIVSPALACRIGPHTVADWLRHDQPTDGSRLELLVGHYFVSARPGGPHQAVNAELRAVLKASLRSAGRADLYPVTSVGLWVSTAWRTGLIPDLVVTDQRLSEETLLAEHVELVTEIWLPSNAHSERQTKKAAYAGAGVLYFWAVDFGKDGAPTITAHRLVRGDYEVVAVAKPGSTTTIDAAPVPVTLDPAHLLD
jgi:Uma2 family endonuclease